MVSKRSPRCGIAEIVGIGNPKKVRNDHRDRMGNHGAGRNTLQVREPEKEHKHAHRNETQA